MILKGNARAGGQELATHLQNTRTNSRVEVAELRGFAGVNLHEAFAEIEAIASGTRAEEYLYSLSVNPTEPMTREQYGRAIDRVEGKLGLTDQPRAVVFHVKEGREHAHVVWSRIDVDKMQAVQLSFDRQKLRECARELGREFGHALPAGIAQDRGADRFADRFNDNSFVEQAQQHGSGLSADDRRAQITVAYRQADTGTAFVGALEERGYYLAQGDRRAFVVVDRAGDVHSLARQIDGARAKDVKAKLSPLTPDKLPSVDEAKRFIAQRLAAQADRSREAAAAAAAEKAQVHETHHGELVAAQKAELKALHGDHKTAMAGLRERETETAADIKDRVKAAYKPEWRTLFQRQKQERSEFGGLAHNPIKRLAYYLRNKDYGDKLAPSARGTLSKAFNFIVRGELDPARMEKRHTAERRSLADMQHLAAREEIRAARQEFKEERRALTQDHRDRLDQVKEAQARAREESEKILQQAREASERAGTARPAEVEQSTTSIRRSFADRVRAAEGADKVSKAQESAKSQARKDRTRDRDDTGRTRGPR